MTRGVNSPANVSLYLKGIDYPASKEQLATYAEQNGAEAEVLDTIKAMPDRQYEDMADVMTSYGATSNS